MPTKAIATTPANPFPSEDVQLACQLVDQYKKAISGTREVLIFGAMFMQLSSSLELQTARPNQHTPRHETLKGWMEEFCPSINYRTALGFYALARGLREALEIPITTNIHHLLTAPANQLSKKEAKFLGQIDDAIDGKSARQLEFDFGVRKARTSRPESGGAREGAGRKPYSMAREQMEIEALFSKDLLGNLGIAVLEKRWHLHLNDEMKGLLLAIAEQLVRDLGGKA